MFYQIREQAYFWINIEVRVIKKYHGQVDIEKVESHHSENNDRWDSDEMLPRVTTF